LSDSDFIPFKCGNFLLLRIFGGPVFFVVGAVEKSGFV
jgi:hypothetical protein